ncbi:DUF2796 domain-containing protein [Aliiruegeria lutimaris]|uniref:DUF2796 domain-containing protein n=1 Tax=Aliiruegeria lutimaris TaxID=571298 RepID=A0A1G8M6V0_9RHOB|nr:DUF2796 domain-containing protein [Aliiruegeria lutimaris]SDI63676.1 Protein of unknown function [Aliiruegeria lutimaris]
MKVTVLTAFALSAAGAALAQDMHQHDAHVHGRGALDIAVEGENILMELRAPGADIVGFEYPAREIEEKAAVAVALNLLSNPEDLFVLDAAAGCGFVAAEAELHGKKTQDDAQERDDDDKTELADSAEAGGHSEFHAEFVLSCDHIERLKTISLNYFKAFERAEALEVQAISDKGSFSAELTRDAPVLKLEGRI